jgi:tetratricopeptide (TPR) repeat protein
MGEEVFISYSRKDEDFILKLEERLKSFGVRIWRDKRSIPAGEFWDSFIEGAIKQCNRFLIVLSSSCIKSENVKREIDAAISSDRLIVPIRIDGCEIPDQIKKRKHNCIDFSPADLEKDSDSFRLLLEGLGHLHPPESNSFRRPAQIRSPPRNFTGREKELANLLARFKDGAAVIALRGMGGIGKTAVAFKIAEQLKDSYPDGQLLVELDGTGEAPMNPSDAMARIIHSYDAGARLPDDDKERENFYRSFLNKKRALILLDNALDDRQVQPLLPPPESSVIVTSRQELSLPTITVDLFQPDKSIELLKAILAEKRAIKQEYESSLAEIARLCGHLPLALRLAGTFLAINRDRSPEDYAKSLQDERSRVEHIDKGSKRSGESSVQASLLLSYSRLPAEAARVFRLLSVFPLDFDSGAEEAVCQDKDHEQLSELLRWSLVDYQEESKRYRLHDLVRIFAYGKLLEVDGEDARDEARQRHAERYRDVLSSATEIYKNGNALAGLNIFDLERMNIESAWTWAKENMTKSDAAASICSSLLNAPYLLELRHHPRERISWTEIALSAAQRMNDRSMEGVHLGNLGLACFNLGDTRKAIEYYEQAVTISIEIGDIGNEGVWLGNLGLAYSVIGKSCKTIEYYEKAIAIARKIKDRRREGLWLGNLGIEYRNLGDACKAFECYNHALTIARRIKDRQNEGVWLSNMGLACDALGDSRKAIEYYEQALSIAREIGYKWSEEEALNNMGLACDALGDASKAIEYHEHALAIAREIGDKRGEGNALGNLGSAYNNLGDSNKALEYHEKTLAIDREIGYRRGEGADLGNMGNAYINLGDASKAIECYEQRLAIAREIGDRRGEGNALGNMGNAYAALGNAGKALYFHEQALVIARETDDRRCEGIWFGCMGLAYADLGNASKAIECYEQQLAIAREIGDRRSEALTSWDLGLAYAKAGDLRRAVEMMKVCVDYEKEIGHPDAEKHAERLQAILAKLKS